MPIDQSSFSSVPSHAEELDLVSGREAAEVIRLFEPSFAFSDVLGRADSVHVHVRVDDVAQLPHDRLREVSLGAENGKDGYIKYPFDRGINLIFSSIPVSDDDLLTDYPTTSRPFMDHIGVDVRDESDVSRKLFDAVPDTAADLGWRHTAQGGDGQDVFCCHTSVSGKHWVHPDASDEGFTRPIEFAFGELRISAGEMGCDLRPIDPAHPRAGSVPACGAHRDEAAAPSNGATRTTYYDPKDLAKFGDVGAYASAATAEGGLCPNICRPFPSPATSFSRRG